MEMGDHFASVSSVFGVEMLHASVSLPTKEKPAAAATATQKIRHTWRTTRELSSESHQLLCLNVVSHFKNKHRRRR